MKLLQLCKSGVKGVCELYVTDTSVGLRNHDGSGTTWGQSNLATATREFEAQLKQKTKAGWVETDLSYSRRVFVHGENQPGKFWIVWLDQESVEVHFGKISKHGWSIYGGQKKSKHLLDREQALVAYERMIAEKLAEGYEELYQRKTDYSHLGEELARKKQATPKPVRKPKEIPAADNLAQMLTVPAQRAVNIEVTHQIDLAPIDWFTATWKTWTPLPRPKPVLFDQEACVQRALTVKTKSSDWLSRLQIPRVMTKQEAHFWFELLLDSKGNDVPADAAKKLSGKTFDGKVDLKRIQLMHDNLFADAVRVISFLVSPEQFLEVFLNTGHDYWLSDRFREEVLIYCSDAELKSLRKFQAPKIDIHVQAQVGDHTYPPPIYFGATIGCHEKLEELVKSWLPNEIRSGWSYYHTPNFVLSLGNAAKVESEFRRLQFKWDRPEQLRGWLATTELGALDVVRDAILAITNRERCDALLEVFAKVKAPEAAVYMLELSRSAKSPKLARDWLDTEIGNAVSGLLSTAAGTGKLAEAAIQYLREKQNEGHADVIRAALKDQSSDVKNTIQSKVLGHVVKSHPEFPDNKVPTWLQMGVSQAATHKPIPGANFVQIHLLPSVNVLEHRLNTQQVAAVLLALQAAEPAAPGDLLTGLKQHAEPASLDAFAWNLFDQWLIEGAPPKHKWAMRSLGFLGSDAVALRLTPLVRAWPGESQHPRAVLGLECLRAIGTDTALMQLNGIAVKLKFKALQNKAREFMEAIAAEKGLTATELEDRIVPDLDLDQRGTRVFDFGPRQFRFVLGPDMKPVLKDSDGKVKTDLPKPGAKDDAAKAAEAIEAWKLLKKQVKDVATIQSQRLEQALVTGRTWSKADFETLLVKHPLMINLVRLIVWGGYDAKGNLATTFRVTDDQDYADSSDGPHTLKGIATVGIVHPLHLDDAQKSAWGQIFSDYEIFPPFPQIGRPIQSFDKEELKSNQITRFSKVSIPAATLIFGLEKLGWARGQAMDNGHVSGHSKYFPSADLSVAVIFDEGFPQGYREGWEDQKIADIYFVPGQYRVTWGRRWNKDEKIIRLKKVDPVIASEVLGDLSGLAAKGTE